jgi:superfamily II DNA or RNA helicase
MQSSGINSQIQNIDTLFISKINEAYIRIKSNPSVLQELADYFTFSVPGFQFMPAFRNKLWDGKIRLFSPYDQKLYYGLLPYVEQFSKKRNYPYVSQVNEFIKVTNEDLFDYVVSLNLPFDPHDYQFDAMRTGIIFKRMLLISPTASGKSFILYLLIRYLQDVLNKQKILLIVPTTSLTSQMYTDFGDYSKNNGWSNKNNCHVVYAGQDKVSEKPIIISTWQSIYKMKENYFSQFDTVFGDEAHGFKSKSLTSIMTKCINADYRIGCTGTLDGTQTHKLVLEGLFGKVYKSTTTKDLIDKKILSPFKIESLVLQYSDDICESVKKFKYREELDFLTSNINRNIFIKNLALTLKGNTLILFSLVKHGKDLYKLIKESCNDDRKVFFIFGGTATEQREQFRGITEQSENAIIVASYGVYSTGVNIRKLHNIVFASPSKSRIRNLQSIGRGLRKSQSKEMATLYDISDDLTWKSKTNFTLNHFKERIKLYNEENFPYKIRNINFKG